jgi:hypothetical protein
MDKAGVVHKIEWGEFKITGPIKGSMSFLRAENWPKLAEQFGKTNAPWVDNVSKDVSFLWIEHGRLYWEQNGIRRVFTPIPQPMKILRKKIMGLWVIEKPKKIINLDSAVERHKQQKICKHLVTKYKRETTDEWKAQKAAIERQKTETEKAKQLATQKEEEARQLAASEAARDPKGERSETDCRAKKERSKADCHSKTEF